MKERGLAQIPEDLFKKYKFCKKAQSLLLLTIHSQ